MNLRSFSLQGSFCISDPSLYLVLHQVLAPAHSPSFLDVAMRLWLNFMTYLEFPFWMAPIENTLILKHGGHLQVSEVRFVQQVVL